jgi:hypothetical protein
MYCFRLPTSCNFRSIAIALVVAMWPLANATAIPITDVVLVNGQTWAQVDLFRTLSWNDMNQVCPAGVCRSGQLNGYDMADWRWASESDMQALFTHYIGAPIAGFSVEKAYSTWAPAFFEDGWRSTAFFMQGQRYTNGALSTDYGFKYVNGRMIDYDEAVILATQGTIRNDLASLHWSDRKNIGTNSAGGWFYQVPEPNTAALFAIGLLTITGLRRRGFGWRLR